MNEQERPIGAASGTEESTRSSLALQDLRLEYGAGALRVVALDGITATITGPTICGLLGRNGSGKTSLMSVIAGFQPPTSGTVAIARAGSLPEPLPGSEALYTGNDSLDGYLFKPADLMDLYACARPNWDEHLARHLLSRFEVPTNRPIRKLSLGQRSALLNTLAIASHAPVTLLDESYLGMDPIARDILTSELLRDFAEHPRIILFSTHEIEDWERIFSDVLIIAHGQLLLQQSADDIRATGKSIKELFTSLVTNGANHD
jgi:ABC-2 type transport system ATP-binding protein